jgi:membrane-associated protease RseP (regulator of RpoE activity)
VWLHVLLFVVTFASTTLVGAEMYASFATDFGQRPRTLTSGALLLGGLWYGVTVMLILGCHEMGHYLACRYYGIRASLPYFLPAPAISIFGTLGAVIRIREPLRHKRSLFDIGIAGPLAGIAMALPVLVFGLLASRFVPIPPSAAMLGEPLAFQLLARWVMGPIPAGLAINLHPAGFAAWFGMLLTGLNLVPAGQLDGGHVAYACFGRRAIWLTALSLLSALAAGLFLAPMWLFWLGFISVLLSIFGWRHAPVLDEDAPLGTARWVVALLAVVLLVFCFIPVPLQ